MKNSPATSLASPCDRANLIPRLRRQQNVVVLLEFAKLEQLILDHERRDRCNDRMFWVDDADLKWAERIVLEQVAADHSKKLLVLLGQGFPLDWRRQSKTG